MRWSRLSDAGYVVGQFRLWWTAEYCTVVGCLADACYGRYSLTFVLLRTLIIKPSPSTPCPTVGI